MMTDFLKKLNDVYSIYYNKSRISAINRSNYMRFLIIAQLKHKILCEKNNNIEEIPQKVKFDSNIKRKYIISIFSELGLKVTRYTREYGKTIVYFEPINS